ncbi:MAG TPA: hypothetical protein VNR64_06440 [Vicinamibacterales bacterium]|nr:hypothetical protein [Vicinamibacterales bacterium]
MEVGVVKKAFEPEPRRHGHQRAFELLRAVALGVHRAPEAEQKLNRGIVGRRRRGSVHRVPYDTRGFAARVPGAECLEWVLGGRFAPSAWG